MRGDSGSVVIPHLMRYPGKVTYDLSHTVFTCTFMVKYDYLEWTGPRNKCGETVGVLSYRT